MEIISLDHLTVTFTRRLIRKTVNHHTCTIYSTLRNFKLPEYSLSESEIRLPKDYAATGLYLHRAVARLGREASRHTWHRKRAACCGKECV
jgi:hypothetical protein